MTPVDIEKLKELVAKATPGWCGAMVAAFGMRLRRAAMPQDVRECLADRALAEQLATAMPQIAALIAKAERVDAMDWLSGQTRLELHHYSPVYGDDDDQAIEWRVTEVSGPINDREWTTVGRGETAIDAILSARNALSPKPEISDPTKRMEKILGAKFTRRDNALSPKESEK